MPALRHTVTHDFAGPLGYTPATTGQPVRSRCGEFLCSRNHFNDPRARFCAQCGIPTDQLTNVPVTRPRPPLGLLVFDDGISFQLDGDYLVGRAPESDARVAQDGMRPLQLTDPQGRLSRVHLCLRLDGWDVFVVDEGSANGTFVQPSGDSGWARAGAATPVRIVAGARVGLGGRSFVFQSVFGVG